MTEDPVEGPPDGRERELAEAEQDPVDGRERQLAEALSRERPVPPPSFRGALGRHLRARDPGYGPRPARLRAIVGACGASGLVLILVGLLQATGSL